MDLKGLTINFLGDSITEGYGTSDPKKTYHQIIKEKYNMEFAYNYGVSGTRIARQTVPTKESTKYDLTFELRADIMNRDADAVVVFGGTNDFGHGDAPFGTEDSDDIYTFCGALNSLIKKLKKDFKGKKIIFMTPIHRVTEDNPSFPDGKILKDYAEAIVKICKNNNVDIIDLFNINPLDAHDKKLVPDGLHPSDAGHEILAEAVAEGLLSL